MRIEVFVAQGQGVDPLCDEVLHGVRDLRWRTLIYKAGGTAVQEAGMAFNCAQEQRPAVGRDIAAMKAGDDRSCPQWWEGMRRFATLCQRKGGLLMQANVFLSNPLCHRRLPFPRPL